jgi:hypothetical protein
MLKNFFYYYSSYRKDGLNILDSIVLAYELALEELKEFHNE